MKIRGIAFLGRKDNIIKSFGKLAWDKFESKLNVDIPYFKDEVLPLTLIPAEYFLHFQENLVSEFFGGEQEAYWIIGEASAESSLINGPFKSYLPPNNIKEFAEKTLPLIAGRYFTEVSLKSVMNENNLQVTLHTPISHFYFEGTVFSYFKRALELASEKSVSFKKIKGCEGGNKDISYEYYFN